MVEPRIAIAMIVKNEEEMLPRCLQSAKGLWDELIVVDTGSTDRTVEIAESFGASVYHHPWEGSFSKARNISVDYADKAADWVFILDADETLEGDSVQLLRDAVKHLDGDLIAIKELSVAKGGVHESGHSTIRLWKAGMGVHYEGSVHNELIYKGRVRYVPAQLYHYGYDLSREKMIAKFERTTGLLHAELEKEPDNPKWSHYLAISYHTENFYAEALQMAERSIEACGEDYATKIRWLPGWYLAAACRLALGDIEGAKRRARQAVELMDNYVDAWAVLTSVHFMQNDSEALGEAAERFLTLRKEFQQNPEPFNLIPMHTLNHVADVKLRLAMSAIRMSDMGAFRKQFEQAKAEAKSVSDVFSKTVRYMLTVGRVDEALSLLDDELNLQGNAPELVEQKLNLLLELKRFDAAREALDEAKANGFDGVRAQYAAGLVELLAGENAVAKGHFEQILADDPDYGEARINLGMALERLKQPEQAEAAYLEAIDRDPDKLDAAINLGNLYARHGQLKQAIAFLEKVTERDMGLYDVHLKLARLYWDIDDLDRMLQRGAMVARMLGVVYDPNTIGTAANLGDLFKQTAARLRVMRRFKATVLACDMAQLLLPDDDSVSITSGESLMQLGQFQTAIQAFEQAARKNPHSIEAFTHMALCYEILGVDEAVAMCRERIEKLENESPTVH